MTPVHVISNIPEEPPGRPTRGEFTPDEIMALVESKGASWPVVAEMLRGVQGTARSRKVEWLEPYGFTYCQIIRSGCSSTAVYESHGPEAEKLRLRALERCFEALEQLATSQQEARLLEDDAWPGVQPLMASLSALGLEPSEAGLVWLRRPLWRVEEVDYWVGYVLDYPIQEALIECAIVPRRKIEGG